MIAKLYIKTGMRGNITFLEQAYNTHPFKVANITEDKKDVTLRLMLMSSSPGVLDGDTYRMKIDIAKSCSLDLKTQSYQRLFNMKTGASQHLEVQLKEEASFCYLPHPCVPHRSSVFSVHNKVLLSDHCRLIWGEVLTCGRKLNGEVFLFSKFHSKTEIFLNDKLLIKENILVRPSIIDINAIGQLEGYTHQATLIYLSEKADTLLLISRITTFLSGNNDISFGITAAPINGIILRILGFKAEELFNYLNIIASTFLISKQTEYAV